LNCFCEDKNFENFIRFKDDRTKEKEDANIMLVDYLTAGECFELLLIFKYKIYLN